MSPSAPTLAQRVAAPLTPAARLRCDVVLRMLSDVQPVRTFLEVGCGQGALATLLAPHCEYVGYEPDEASFRVAQRRLRGHSTATVLNSMVPAATNRQFDVVGAFEVLEHLEDDAGTLASWARWVRPGGWLMLSVPAHLRRFGAADRSVGHVRRYSRADVLALLASVGLVRPQVVVYGFPLGYALEAVRNHLAKQSSPNPSTALEDRTAASGRWLQPGERIAPLIWLATLPFQVLQRPFGAGDLGTGFVARAQRPD